MPQIPVRTHIAKQQPITLGTTATVADAARRMKKGGVSAVMVVAEGGGLAGIFTERDALYRVLAEGRDPGRTRLANVMTVAPKTIHPDKPFAHALHMMYDGGFRHVPVVEDGKPVGMVSVRDALSPEIVEFEQELLQRQRIGEILG